MDWGAIVRAGLVQLRLKPAELWALTPAEFAMMMGFDAVPGHMTRDLLDQLSALYPDEQKEQ